MRVSLVQLFLLFFCSVASAKPEYFQPQAKETLRFLTELNYFSTQSNYDAQGNSSELASGAFYQGMNVDVGGQYALTPRLYVGGEMGFPFTESSDSVSKRTNSTLGEAKLWAQYAALIRPVRLIPELLFVYPFNRIDEASDETLTGEGAMALQPGLWLSKPLGRFELFSYLGVRLQDEDRATLLPYRAGARYHFQKFFVGAGFNGHEVLVDDKTSPIERARIVNRVNGRSLKYYSFNPSLLEADIWAGMKFTRTSEARVGFSQTLTGKNSAEDFTVHLAFHFELYRPSQGGENKRHFEPKFQLENEEYDSTLFEAEPPPKPKKMKRPKRYPGPADDQLIDDTMNTLENL